MNGKARNADAPKKRLVDFSPAELFRAVEDEWQEQALCAQTDPDAFFQEKGGSTQEAKRICRACAVREPCLRFALENDERYGVWGGLSRQDRERLVKRREQGRA